MSIEGNEPNITSDRAHTHTHTYTNKQHVERAARARFDPINVFVIALLSFSKERDDPNGCPSSCIKTYKRGGGLSQRPLVLHLIRIAVGLQLRRG